jgi:hypothetical protein
LLNSSPCVSMQGSAIELPVYMVIVDSSMTG